MRQLNHTHKKKKKKKKDETKQRSLIQLNILKENAIKFQYL